MNVYAMQVHDDDFGYDKIDECVVIASEDEEAYRISKRERNVKWVIEKKIKVGHVRGSMLVESYIHYG